MQIDSGTSPCADFFFRSQNLQKFEDLDPTPANPALIPNTSSQNESQFEDLDATLKVGLTLIVLWKVSDTKVICLRISKTESYRTILIQGKKEVREKPENTEMAIFI